MGRQARWTRRVVVALALLGALVYGILVPLGEAPDEPGHYNYARILAGEQRLPLAEEEHEAFQPPLYYALAAPLVALGDLAQLPLLANSDFTLAPQGPSFLLVHTAEERFPYSGWARGWHLMRLLSAGLGALTAYSLFQVGLLISGGSVSVAMLGAAAMVLMPQFSLTHGAATNDSLALALGSLLVGQVVVTSLHSRPRRHLLAVGALWGLAVLAKTSLLAAGAGLALALWTGRRRLALVERAREAALDLLVVGLGAVAVSGWWFGRNVALFEGPLAWDLVERTNAVRQGSVVWTEELWGLHRSYWLSYVGMRLPSWVYWAALVPGAGACLGLGRALLRLRGPRGSFPEDDGEAEPCLPPEGRAGNDVPRVLAAQARESERDSRLRLLAPVLLLYAAAFAVAWARWSLAVMGTGQARLLYPAAAAVVPLLAVGVLALVPCRWRGRVGALGVAGLCFVNLYGLTAGVVPVFRPSATVAPEAVPTGQKPIVFGGRLELLAWEVPAQVQAGEEARLSLWWRALEPLSHDAWLTVRVVNAEGEVVAWRRGTPDGGPYTPECWTPGSIVAGRRSVPPDLAPGLYAIEVGVQPLDGGDWWPIAAGPGPPADVWTLGEFEVREPG